MISIKCSFWIRAKGEFVYVDPFKLEYRVNDNDKC